MTRNVVLLCLDSVRKDVFDMYARNLRKGAEVSFDECRAASGWSVPSHASMLTGTLPHQHGVHVYNCDYSTIPKRETFLDALEHTTYGVSANVWASSQFGFDMHFDHYVNILPYMRYDDGMDVRAFMHEHHDEGPSKYLRFLLRCLQHESPLQSLSNGFYAKLDGMVRTAPVPSPFDDGATEICQEVRSFVAEETDPFFLFVNFMEAHGPMHTIAGFDRSLYSVSSSWTSPDFWEINKSDDIEQYREDVRNYRQLYAAAVAYLDEKIDSLITDIQQRTDRETTIIVTADHGENLGYRTDERVVGHRGTMSEALLHVPFYVFNPPSGFENAGEQYVSHLSLRDLIPAIADDEVINVGRDRIAAERIGSRVPDTLTRDQRAYWNRMIRCVYTPERKVTWDSRNVKQEYKLSPGRPCWQRETSTKIAIEKFEQSFFDEPLQTYWDRVRKGSGEERIDAETQQRLEQLGYM